MQSLVGRSPSLIRATGLESEMPAPASTLYKKIPVEFLSYWVTVHFLDYILEVCQNTLGINACRHSQYRYSLVTIGARNAQTAW